MIKWLLVIAVLVAFYFIVVKKMLQKSKNDSKKGKEEIMLECKKCGTYISDKEAIIKDGKHFCSKNCAGL